MTDVRLYHKVCQCKKKMNSCNYFALKRVFTGKEGLFIEKFFLKIGLCVIFIFQQYPLYAANRELFYNKETSCLLYLSLSMYSLSMYSLSMYC